MIKLTGDRLKNKEPFYNEEAVAAIHFLALNLDYLRDLHTDLKMRLGNLDLIARHSPIDGSIIEKPDR